jgi:hypothetical protein
MNPGVWTVYRWELRKLISLKRTYLGLFAAIGVPLAFTITLSFRHGHTNDVPFGAYVHQSGLAIPLVLLTFASAFLLPLITSLVAGDIVASEDQNGTLKTILTRSLQRGQIYFGKVFAAVTYTIVALLLLGVVSIVAGSIVSGFNSLTTLSGTSLSAGSALLLVMASFGVYLIPLVTVALLGVMLDHHPQQRGRRRGHAGNRALDRARRHPSGTRDGPALPVDPSVRCLARAPAPADRLVADYARGLGVCPVLHPGACGGVPGLPAPGRRRRLTRRDRVRRTGRP